jgi:hypothetical protein
MFILADSRQQKISYKYKTFPLINCPTLWHCNSICFSMTRYYSYTGRNPKIVSLDELVEWLHYDNCGGIQQQRRFEITLFAVTENRDVNAILKEIGNKLIEVGNFYFY